MKIRLPFCTALVCLCLNIHAQTLFVPEGSTGIGVSSNNDVGIGTNSPSNEQGWNKVLDIRGYQHAKLLVTTTGQEYRTGIFSHTSWFGGGGFVGTESYHNLHLIAGYDVKMSILTNGNVGIGTTSPQQKLDISGVTRTTHTEFYEGNTWCGFIGRGGSYTGGWAAIPDALTVTYAGRDFAIGGWRKSDGIWNGVSLFINSDNNNVLIGKTTQSNSSYKLDVAGKIRADEITVNTTGADFVFHPSYKLRSLSEVETFIKTNQHLPDIAPASQMQEDGVSVSEMQTKLLQKVEELTLYILQQEKKIEALQEEITELKKSN